MKEEIAYLDWFIGNKRVHRWTTTAFKAGYNASVGERRQFNGKFYKIVSIKHSYPSALINDNLPYRVRLYLKAVD
jgi:hypothetical protein